MKKITVSIFDWSGDLVAEMKEDANKFNFSILGSTKGDMGFIDYEIIGSPKAINNFLSHYEIEDCVV